MKHHIATARPFAVSASLSHQVSAWLVVLLAALLLAPMAAHGQDAPPKQVLLPQPQGMTEHKMGLAITLHLQDRLQICRGAQPTEGQRARSLANQLGSAALDLNGEQFWTELTSQVAVDAIVELRFDDSPRDPRPIAIIITTAEGQKRTELPDKANPRQLALTCGRILAETLHLSAADRDILTSTDIEDPRLFLAYHGTRYAWAKWPMNPYKSEVEALLLLPESDHWAYHMARLTSGTGYIASTTTRDAEPLLMRSSETFIRHGVAHLSGTPHEERIYSGLQALPRVEAGEELLEGIGKMLLDIVQPLTYGETIGGDGKAGGGDLKAIDDMEALLGDDSAPMGLPGGAVDKPNMVSSLTGGKTKFTHENRLGAVRVLGVIQSTKAAPVFEKLAKRDDATVRAAVATALGHYETVPNAKLLESLTKDNEQIVRFAALRSQQRQGNTAVAGTLKQLAGQLMAGDSAMAHGATLLWISLADSGDVAQLKQLAQSDDAEFRRAAAVAIAKQQPVGRAEHIAMLRAPDSAVVLHAIKQLGQGDVTTVREALMQAAQDPSDELAWAARDALAPLRPTDAQGRMAFDLATSHHYKRTQIVKKLATMSEPWARQLLVDAGSNSNSHTRRAALDALASLDATQAHDVAIAQLSDINRLVRTNAARHLTKLARSGDGDAMRTAVAGWSGTRVDVPGQIYADIAIAKADGKPAPSPRPAARSIAGKRNLSWLCGGSDPDSPYDAYYQLSAEVSDGWKKAYEAGKIYFARIVPIGHPGGLITDPGTSDHTWLALQSQLNDENMPYIDGVVYGEETMSMKLETVWTDGWRLFCDEAGIDHTAVAGDIEKLSPIQHRAWKDWAHTRVIEGFNELYDLTRMIFDAKRPGLQVCTFMTEQKLLHTPAHASEIDWKFDVGAIYHYVGHTRKDAYSLVRRIRTIWPDRPVLWLTNGIGVYERTPIKYTHKAPRQPLATNRYRAYTDALTAWAAGADTGWFSHWPFQAYDWVDKGMSSLRGPTIKPESIYPESAALKNAIEYSFKGVEEQYRDEAERKAVGKKDIGLPDEGAKATAGFDDLLPEELGGKPAVDQHAQRVIDEKIAMDLGFQFYRKYLYDLANLFRSLPRQTEHYDTLVIQPGLNVWYGSIGSPGSDLLASYDFLLDINKTARLPLDRYRFIAVKDPGLLTDDTIAALTQWLRDTPGILYVHGNLSDNNAAEASTAADLDGQLQNDWPWESAIQLNTVPTDDKGNGPKAGAMTLTGSAGSVDLKKAAPAVTLKLLGSNATALLSHDGQPMLALWRDPAFKGAVVFDAVDTGQLNYRTTLRDQLNALHSLQQLGIAITEPSRFEINRDEHFDAIITAGSAESLKVQGVDVLTGLQNPTVGPGKSAAMILHDFNSPHVVAINGVTILSETPIESVEPIANGLRVSTPGLFHAVSLKPLNIAPNLPRIDEEKVGHWVIHGKGQLGVGVLPSKQGDNTGQRTWIRAKGPVSITTN